MKYKFNPNVTINGITLGTVKDSDGNTLSENYEWLTEGYGCKNMKDLESHRRAIGRFLCRCEVFGELQRNIAIQSFQ